MFSQRRGSGFHMKTQESGAGQFLTVQSEADMPIEDLNSMKQKRGKKERVITKVQDINNHYFIISQQHNPNQKKKKKPMDTVLYMKIIPL